MNALRYSQGLIWLIVCQAICLILPVQAQNLPNVQKGGVYTAGKIKIDGRSIELNNSFQAYNKAIECYYTVSNDENSLYLTVQSKLSDVIQKIIMGGITFSISPTRDKKDLSTIQVTYPVLEGEGRASLLNFFIRKGILKREGKDADVDVTDLNKAFVKYVKNISVKGLFDGDVQVLSIYNEEGVKGAAEINPQLIYTCEMELPLKYIKALNAGTSSFKYNIQLNAPDEKPYLNSSNAPPGPPIAITSASKTDFWGDYTLAKKP